MDTQKIVAEIDAEISLLKQVKALLTRTNTAENRKSGRNSMAGSSGKKRTLSAEARERIAAAQRARWAKSKKALKKRATRNTSPVSAHKKATTANPAVKSAKRRSMSPKARLRMAAGQKELRGVANSPAKRIAIPAKGAKKSVPAKKARSAETAGASNMKSPVAPPAPAAPVTVV